ncbi:hypothetical protein HRR83_001922 [Exophiala dermatitidis]|uniref:Peptidase A1 domain-containing protein n=2 Tax=Exophiala dermatitidis TaxID=5970 RepID=H6BZF0_EXODN|nr:uncharacterized protein HMPREF1120_05067 [Exophiala dermatitidis NIH/UT8656]KAJ4514428.1 hypothetical protein HRR73_005456 [Exophiala dermatitidis]EHY57013.1 hypothetical protein HMPREF1120_05067 [Exophiala dermatitidis NIH/UT8656]KAJ4523806.1 hypothetical protein HRR74_001999 [Exophiala dermatitidis]KAJ4537256.1 hypothetical protein HRR76_005269 [Exophiala dermatitidis]KAJ4555146.1 hypothetical protein HRR77_001087 [Exophiala dermatitidis]
MGLSCPVIPSLTTGPFIGLIAKGPTHPRGASTNLSSLHSAEGWSSQVPSKPYDIGELQSTCAFGIFSHTLYPPGAVPYDSFLAGAFCCWIVATSNPSSWCTVLVVLRAIQKKGILLLIDLLRPLSTMSICPNGAPPMVLPWGNVTVTTDQKAITRGIPVALGNPPQIVSLRPSTSDDILYVVNKEQCAPDYNATCIGSWGGVFDYSSSNTFHQVAQGQWNGSTDALPTQLSFVTFNDVLSFGNATVYGFPAVYDEPGYGGQGVLPLGWGSDFLGVAVESGAAPSTVYGLWTGSRSVEAPVDGALVIGGYDTARVKGDLTTFHAREDCEMCAVVTELTWESVNGSHNLFSNFSESLQINLQPSERYLYVPQNVFDNFQNATGGIYVDPYLGYKDLPKGNLTVTLQNGYKTSIPAEELFMNPRGYLNGGTFDIIDDSYMISTLVNTTNTGYVLDWGIPYLTMNYIIGDFKRQQFQMAPAIRTDFSKQGGGYAVKATCDPTDGKTVPGTTGSDGTNGTASGVGANGTSPATPEVTTHHKNKHTGAIVGGVVGGVGGLALIAGAIGLWICRRRRRRNAAAAAPVGGHPGGPESTPMMGGNPMSPHVASPTTQHQQWTPMSPTEVSASELGSEPKQATNVHVNQWLSSQASDTQTVVSSTSPPTSTAPTYHNMAGSDGRFEMPAQPWDTK